MYPLCGGSLFHGKAQASHAALGASLGLTREWTGKLLKKLRDAKWIETYAPRRPDGKLREIMIYRPGKMLKRLLIMLLRSKQRSQKPHVNTFSQKVPTEQERAKNKALFAELIAQVGKNLEMNPAQKR
jgi:ferredoxin-NADP reductase